MRTAGLTHICRSGSRARIYLIYVRPVHAVKSQSWGRKAVPAFTLSPHRLRRCPRSNRHPPATVIHNGLSTEKLSTSLLAALCKTVSLSRLRTRIYNIGFALAIYIGFALAPLWHRGPRRRAQGGGGRRQRRTPPCTATRPCLSTAAPPPPKWVPRLRRREGKRPNGAPPHHNAHTPNAARKRYLHNSRTKTQRRTKRCAQFVIFVFTPCKLLHNFSTVLHRSPRDVPKRAQIVARRPDFPCFTARFSLLSPESHRAKHPRTAPVLPPKNAPLRAYAKPRSYPRVRGTRQHATTCAFFTFSARYERIGGARIANFCPAEGRKWGRLRSQMLKNGLQTKKSTFSFGRLVI